MSRDIKFEKNLHYAFRTLGQTGFNNDTFSAFHGIRATGGLPRLPANTDERGYIFFTRPDMNLSYDNVIQTRRMAALSNTDPLSMGNLLRCMMDPIHKDKGGSVNDRSTIFNDKQAFMTILTNTCMTFSGMPDFSVERFTSQSGWSREQVTFTDSLPYMREAWNASATFMNMEGDPLTSLFLIWTEYQTRLVEGVMTPYPHNKYENRIDYMTGIYRFTLDNSGRYVKHVCRTIGFPVVAPISAVFEYDVSKPTNDTNSVISQDFACMGLEVDDPILIWEFNDVVREFNKVMTPANRAEARKFAAGESEKPGKLHQLLGDEITKFSGYAYPAVEDDMEFCWYMEQEEYKLTMEILEKLKQ